MLGYYLPLIIKSSLLNQTVVRKATNVTKGQAQKIVLTKAKVSRGSRLFLAIGILYPGSCTETFDLVRVISE